MNKIECVRCGEVFDESAFNLNQIHKICKSCLSDVDYWKFSSTTINGMLHGDGLKFRPSSTSNDDPDSNWKYD